MKQLALFVEGQTEQIFVHRLVEEIAGRHCITVELLKCSGGKQSPRVITLLRAVAATGTLYRILIYDCGTDNRVLSDIRDQYASLERQGYDLVLGLRDVFPRPATDAPRITAAIRPFMPVGALRVAMVLAIAEIEAWFLAEDAHYGRLHPGLTAPVIAGVLGCALGALQVESVPHPSETLHQIYRTVGLAYHKDRQRVQRTVDALDCANLYLQLPARIPALAQFISELDRFFAP